MVLANGSIMAIDEGDKMSEEDRSNLHEGMSIGSITINKAGINATLPARTSVLMAANPKRGRFNHSEDLIEQINLAPSLLSRFDFIYIIKDKPNEDGDRDIADKILSEHSSEFSKDILSIIELRKYIYLAKQIDPVMTDEAKKIIRDFYVDLRKKTKEAGDGSLIIPITPRQLESLIRLSEAHARLKMRHKVGIDDAKHAVKVMRDYLYEFGYDEKSGLFDVDKIIGTSSSTRGKMDLILKAFSYLETGHLDHIVPVIEVEKHLEGKIEQQEIYNIILKLNQQGDLLNVHGGYKRI
jgi:replicative DNA helicase Mcm